MTNVTVTRVSARGALGPMNRPLAISGGRRVAKAPLALIDLHASDGAVGRAYVFIATPVALRAAVAAIEDLGAALVGAPLAPRALYAQMHGLLRLAGPHGVFGQALSGIDMAAWDALARGRGLPLYAALGAAATPIRAYNSNGLGLIGADAVPAEAQALAEGFSGVKLRLGYPTLAEDLAAVRAARAALDPGVALMTDYNQGLRPAEAADRARAVSGEGLAWIEEPVRADDVPGHAQTRRAARCPIMTGENAWGPPDVERMFAGGGCDLIMPDAGKIWGVTGWLDAAGMAAARDIPLSSHLYPEYSVHLLAASPTRDWLEYVDWADWALRARPYRLENGVAQPDDAPGAGLEWDEAAITRYAA